MNTLTDWLGKGENLTAFQMSCRAVIVFFITLMLIRIGGVRIFGRRSSHDTIIIIIMGAVLSRGIVGASPLVPTIAASTAMILIHRILGFLSLKSKKIEAAIKGSRTILYESGQINTKNLFKCSLSKEDLLESLHLETKHTTLENVEVAYLETNGRISFILKPQKKNQSPHIYE